MPKILVIHGAGMNMRGKVQLDVFGPMTLPEYDERIRGYAKELAGRGPLPGQVPHDRGAHLEPDPPGAGLTDRAVSQSVVAGFGIAGYALALRGIRDQLAAKK